MATHDEDDGLCVLCYAQPRVLRYRPCGHCVACERCAIRHVLAQLQAGELRPRCSHGCGAEIVDVLRVERADPPIFERDEGNASCQPGAHSLEAFLERAAQKVLRCSVAQDASQAWLRLREAAGARRQLAFFEAVEAGDLDGCVALRRAGASVSAADRQQLQPLHICAQLGLVELARWLVSEGAAVGAVANGQVALHFACVHGELVFAQWLAEEGADVHCRADNGAAPLHGACQEGHLEVARWLLDAGAAVDPPDEDGSVPLHAACQEGHAEVAQLLRERGADLAAADLDGRTALHFASVNGHLEVARWLVGEGVAADSRDAMGRRAVDYACFSGHTAVARYLCGLASGACRTETELRLVLRHPRLKLEQYTERLVIGGYCISALQRLAATELRAVGIEGGAMKQGHAARLAKHFHEAVEEVAGSAVASLGEGIFTGFSLDRTEGG